MKLPPEVNLLAVAHYLQALEVQRYANKIVSILGSKTPHIQNVAVGGVANPLALDSQSVLTVERLLASRAGSTSWTTSSRTSIWSTSRGHRRLLRRLDQVRRGITDYLAVPDIPLDGKGTKFALPGGHIANGDLGSFKPITSFNDEYWAEGRRGERSSTPGTRARQDKRCTPTRARPSRSTPTSRTTASTPG
jgi:hydrogenase large subunit